MSKNFVQEGKTIPLTNAGTTEIASGDIVVVGAVVAVAITDIAPGFTGDGFAEGVFLLPKLTADSIAAGVKVYFNAGLIQLPDEDASNAAYAGVAWSAAGAGETVVEVKINA